MLLLFVITIPYYVLKLCSQTGNSFHPYLFLVGHCSPALVSVQMLADSVRKPVWCVSIASCCTHAHQKVLESPLTIMIANTSTINNCCLWFYCLLWLFNPCALYLWIQKFERCWESQWTSANFCVHCLLCCQQWNGEKDLIICGQGKNYINSIG